MRLVMTALALVVFVSTMAYAEGTNAPPKRPAAKVAVEWPAAPPAEMDAAVCRTLEQYINKAGSILAMTCIIRFGMAEIYVEGRSGTDSGTFVDRIEKSVQATIPLLPTSAKLAKTEDFTDQPIPLPQGIHTVDCQVVEIDRKKAAMLKVPLNDAYDEINKARNEGKFLADLAVEIRGGRKIPLRNFAVIKMVRGPDQLVRGAPAPKENSGLPEILEFRLAQSIPTNGWTKTSFGKETLWLSPEADLVSAHVASAEFKWWTEPPMSPELIAKAKKLNPAFTVNTNRYPRVWVTLTEDGGDLLAKITARNRRRRLAILSEGRILTAPVISASVTGGVAVIAGNLSESEAKALVEKLNRSKEPAD